MEALVFYKEELDRPVQTERNKILNSTEVFQKDFAEVQIKNLILMLVIDLSVLNSVRWNHRIRALERVRDNNIGTSLGKQEQQL